MLITSHKMLDLFQRGNYIGSFENTDEINKYLSGDKDRMIKSFGYSQKSAIGELNARTYTVIESEHLIFCE